MAQVSSLLMLWVQELGNLRQCPNPPLQKNLADVAQEKLRRPRPQRAKSKGNTQL